MALRIVREIAGAAIGDCFSAGEVQQYTSGFFFEDSYREMMGSQQKEEVLW